VKKDFSTTCELSWRVQKHNSGKNSYDVSCFQLVGAFSTLRKVHRTVARDADVMVQAKFFEVRQRKRKLSFTTKSCHKLKRTSLPEHDVRASHRDESRRSLRKVSGDALRFGNHHRRSHERTTRRRRMDSALLLCGETAKRIERVLSSFHTLSHMSTIPRLFRQSSNF